MLLIEKHIPPGGRKKERNRLGAGGAGIGNLEKLCGNNDLVRKLD